MKEENNIDIFHIIFIFCDTPAPQNMNITWTIPTFILLPLYCYHTDNDQVFFQPPAHILLYNYYISENETVHSCFMISRTGLHWVALHQIEGLGEYGSMVRRVAEAGHNVRCSWCPDQSNTTRYLHTLHIICILTNIQNKFVCCAPPPA